MSLIWLDGFDAYGTNGQDISDVMRSSLYVAASCTASQDTRSGRGYCARFHWWSASGYNLRKAFETKSELVVGFAWRTETVSELKNICEFQYDDHFGSNHKQFGLWMAGDGALTVGYFNANGNRVKLFDTGPNLLFPNVWHFIEVKISFHDSNGSIQVRIDGQTCISGTGRTKNPAAPSLCNLWRCGLYQLEDGRDTWLDDLYICDTLGTEFNDFLGDVVVHTVLPSEDGSRNDLTLFGGSLQHYSAVDDVPPDGDVSYVYGNTVGAQERYKVDPLPSNVINVLAVSVHARVKKDAAGASGARLLAHLDGVTAIGDVEPVTTQYITRAKIFERAPGGSAWTKAKAEAMEIGFEVA